MVTRKLSFSKPNFDFEPNFDFDNIVRRALLCFDEKTLVTKKGGETVCINELSEGDMILSQKDNNIYHDVVTRCNTIEGKFPAQKFDFENGKTITVTSKHLMLVFNGDELEMTPAREIQENDVMYFEDGFSKVIEISDLILDRKIQLNTKSGLFYANNLLTTGMCENIPETFPKFAISIIKRRLVNYLIVNTDFPKKITLWLDDNLHMTISLTDCYC